MKLILILLLFCTGAFATHPHFDLPKKNAKEQCAEVERVYEECYLTSNNTRPLLTGMHKCGNILFRTFSYGFGLYADGGGYDNYI